MKYYVIAHDGQRYGPADLDLLNAWREDNRLNRETLLEREDGSGQIRAGEVPGIVFESPAPPAQEPLLNADTAWTNHLGEMDETFRQSRSGPEFVSYPRTGVMENGLPLEVARRFNWGAFLLTWIWGVAHKKYFLLLAMVLGLVPAIGPLLSLAFSIWAGMNGNRWAWQSGRFPTVEAMERNEWNWAKWGIIITIGLIIVVVGLSLASGYNLADPKLSRL